MKKLIIVLVVIAGAAGAAVGYVHHRSRDGRSLAAAVPEDTLFYVGPAAATRWAETLRRMGVQPNDSELATARAVLDAYGPAGRMLYGLYAALSERLGQDEIIPGLGVHPRLTLYTIGLVPTAHLALKDPKAFRAFVEDAEKRGGVQARTTHYQGVSLRRYPLAVDGTATDNALVIAIRGKLAVVTVDARRFRDEVLPLALGLKSPGGSIIATRNRAARSHGLEKASISLISYRAIINALTGVRGNLASRMLTALMGGDTPELAPFRTPACQKELGAMADVSPRAISGWSRGGKAQGPWHLKAVSELFDASLTQTLQRLRGHVPAFLRDGKGRPLLSLALAVNMSAPGPVISDLWQRFVSASFRCPELVQAQQDARDWNPGAIAMVTAIASSIRGVSFTLYDLRRSKLPASRAGSDDAIMTLSTEDPESLVALAQGFLPALAKIKIPDDGSPVALPVSPQGGQPLMASVTHKHIALFMGPRAARAAATLKNDKLDANGLLLLSIDYHRLAPILREEADAMESAAAEAASPEARKELRDAVRQMEKVNLRVVESVDIADDGVVLDATLTPTRPK